MLWFIYNILFVLGLLILLPRFLYRMCRRGGYARDFMQRFGIYRPEAREQLGEGGRVWIQAVSVGEVYVAFKFMAELRERHPELKFVLSTNTSTGHAIAEKRMDDRDVLIYFPLDFSPIMRRVLNLIRPKMLILVECELWPNLIRKARRRDIPVVLINGRISEHSYEGYRKVRAFTKALLPEVNLLCVQSRGDGERLKALGAPEDIIHVMGSAKYEVADTDPQGDKRAAELLAKAGVNGDRIILLGGSTWPGEEKILLDAYKRLRQDHPALMLLIAPRHVERTNEILKVISEVGLTVTRRSEIVTDEDTKEQASDVFLIDTTGELTHFFPRAKIIFIGKSLTQHGGQNVIEPAVYGKPILVGPNMENFPVVIEDFLEADGLIQVSDAEFLERKIAELLANPEMCAAYGDRAARLVSEKAGAAKATVDLLEETLSL